MPVAEETERYLIRKLEELKSNSRERVIKKKNKASVSKKGQLHNL